LALRTNPSDLGLVTGTACGLERWYGLSTRTPNPNASLLVTNVSSIRVRGLAYGEYYEVNIVASCDANCLALQVCGVMEVFVDACARG
jgi:hypothetical protein